MDNEEWERLARYAAGEGSPDERAALRRWIEERPERGAILDAMRNVSRVANPDAPRWDSRAAWNALATRLALPTGGAPDSAPPVVPPSRAARGGGVRRRVTPFVPQSGTRRAPAAIAAAAAIFLVAAGSFALWRSEHPASSLATAESAWSEYATRRGQRATIELLDGTHVDLGVDSRLRVRMSSSLRELALEGEAAFDVAHDSIRPLTVRAGNALMKDIGTRFNVRAYPNGRAVQVVVASGVVQLSDSAKPAETALVLGAGDLASIDPRGATRLTRGVDTERFFAWTDGELVFDRTPLSEVAVRLERWFDVEVQIPDSAVASRRVTATIATQSLEAVLGAVTVPLHLRYERRGALVVIARRPTGKATP